LFTTENNTEINKNYIQKNGSRKLKYSRFTSAYILLVIYFLYMRDLFAV